ncbi:ABC transporter ATP-binding protein [Gracilibacillus salinarum]|uniref:ABC transporter ATP-binding protein n=1 Tax=Gracilibacillus salinarum TaxID=2932255 RepID=A0ABY4GRA9_9BACI|nr:ABC transporter ATP-binding protein [Gracilibacillus salinarum]UOQ86794.1 ABC transporter ATP-binding protein [Gracilibacillus salinarum]
MLTLDNISKYYAKHQAVANVSMHIPRGTCYGLVGPNGAGKSTLLKIIASIIQNYSGAIQFASSDTRIGYIPQEISLEEKITANDNLLFFGRLSGLRGKRLTKRVDEVLSEIGLTEQGRDKVGTFSGGMKRRLNIGCGLLHQPNLIIMDEPTVGIDPQSRRYIFSMIEQLKKEGCTIIYASHYMEEIEQLCDETAFMDNGEIIEKGRIESLIEKHAVPSIYVKGQECLPAVLSETDSVIEKDGGYVITTSNPLTSIEQIIRNCQGHHGELERLELVKPRLEDIFFSLTGSQLRD